MNGIRRREDSDEEGDTSYSDATVQRMRVSAGTSELSHYDIYALPSFIPPSPLLHNPSAHFQSCSLFVVNRAAGLSGLGVRIGLTSDPSSPQSLQVVTDPGFSLLREQGYDAQKAVLLGWVEEERLADLEGFVKSCEVPIVRNPPTGGEALEWILNVGRKLEWEGILANADILLSDVLQRR
ncbi:uncharacterized protein JCM6883_001608 [Sporobolomyces salmoneus]|uniref:uncharacterized protein n=1 Tax=Sporobolomyces salmoneus TaxID=183962 RepID=UPI00316CAB2E